MVKIRNRTTEKPNRSFDTLANMSTRGRRKIVYELKWTESDVNTLGPRWPVPYIKKCNLSCERLRNNKGDSIWKRFAAEISESNRPKIWRTNVGARRLKSGTIIIETECDVPNQII